MLSTEKARVCVFVILFWLLDVCIPVMLYNALAYLYTSWGMKWRALCFVLLRVLNSIQAKVRLNYLTVFPDMLQWGTPLITCSRLHVRE